MPDPRDNERQPTSKQDVYETKIDRYRVELGISDPKSTQCDISWRSYSASLACLSDMGVLTDGQDREHIVPATVIADIEAWAYRNGY